MVIEESRIDLPDAPEELASRAVRAWEEPVVIDTYEPVAPHPFPAFLERRVYQGSSGSVYPLPHHERISPTKAPRTWRAVHLENQWLRLLILPELGGRIHVAFDRVGRYDFFYRNNVIKPALVGLAGPWIAGGVEFNWPQHHRPGTYLPVDVSIEEEPDGAVTIWCADHDPMQRMQGMHGIRLRPETSHIEARARLTNRTDLRQTFLWWANVAAPVGDAYQPFFPDDVHHVADHAKRAIVSFPKADRAYYGVDYPARAAIEPGADRLDWYKNIPVPTSYMVTSSEQDFFGGYDHDRRAGFVHWADRRIAPGKKMWSWGRSAFGEAWERNLTDTDGPYIELMAGVFTDNQPDFAFLAPGETKSFSQFWYPIREIGAASAATRDLALRVDAGEGGVEVHAHGAVAVEARLRVLRAAGGDVLAERDLVTGPATPWHSSIRVPEPLRISDLVFVVEGDAGVLLSHRPAAIDEPGEEPERARAPREANEIASADELYLTGRYLQQYRHPSRSPLPYWHRALEIDPGDARALDALAEHHYRLADDETAIGFSLRAVERRTEYVRTPDDGASHYLHGLILAGAGRGAEAEDALHAAAWSREFRVPAVLAIARILASGGRRDEAVARLGEIASVADDARVLTTLAVLRPGDAAIAHALSDHVAENPLDQWARHVHGDVAPHDQETALDVAIEYASVGAYERADALLASADALPRSPGQPRAMPLIRYHRAWVLERRGRASDAERERAAARDSGPQLCFASRRADVAVLREALAHSPSDATAASILGVWEYRAERFDEAERLWRIALGGPAAVAAMAARNLGLLAVNSSQDGEGAERLYRRALELTPVDGKLASEYDQLRARNGVDGATRLAFLEERSEVVEQRDDLAVTFADLLARAGRPAEGLGVMTSRTFQPWEGGEGRVLDAWERIHLALAAEASASGDRRRAIELLEAAIATPPNLGEARHPLANIAHLELALGDALRAAGAAERAAEHWERAAASHGDFVGMAPTAFSERTVHAILALRRLGRDHDAGVLADALAAHVDELERTPASVDFFATSLPQLLLFSEDPTVARDGVVTTLRRDLAFLDGEITEEQWRKDAAWASR